MCVCVSVCMCVGAIVTRLAAIEDMAAMSILCSDKTGTLTMNKVRSPTTTTSSHHITSHTPFTHLSISPWNQMEIQEETPIYKAGESQYSLLRFAAMAAKWKEPPRDGTTP